MKYIQYILFIGAVASTVACKTTTTATVTPVDDRKEARTATSKSASANSRSVASGEPQKNTAIGVILNNTVGGDEGMYISRQMDAQALDIGKEELKGGKILRVGEGIKITYDGGVMFKGNSSTLTEVSKNDLRRISQVLSQHNNTRLVIEGHTDVSGKNGLELSRARAKAVADFFIADKFEIGKMNVVGYGNQQPLFSSDTEEGRRQNSRVEIVIVADENLRAAAKKGP
jgi:outer membrane protein OmpA-like peptidoglycan-associated protein